MATSLKTISYAFDMVTSTVTNNTLTPLTQITVDIPETVIAFESVFLEIGFQDIITATGGTITSSQVDLQLQGAGAPATQTVSAITNTGENLALIYSPLDYTSHFTTNWTGTSRTVDVSVLFNQTTGTTQGMVNVTAILHITYSYDDDVDVNPVQVKTVRIPFDGSTTYLPTAAGTFYGEIPALQNFCPEAATDIKSYFLVFEGNEGLAGVTDFTLSMSIDSGATYSFATQERALSSDRFCRWIYNNSLASVPDTSVEHTVELWSSLANTCGSMTMTLVVTYTYDAIDTTEVCNSIMIPIEFASPLGRNTTADASRFEREIMVMEPGTITMLQSAFRVNFNAVAATATNWRAGSQSYRNYVTNSNQVCGMLSIQQRIDGGGAAGAGMTLARGANKITIDGYTTTVATTPISNINGYIILNYKSSLAPEGEGSHNKTVFSEMKTFNSVTTIALWNDFTWSLSIPQSNYFLTSTAVVGVIAFTAANCITLDLKLEADENKGSGYLDIYTDIVNTDPEMGTTYGWFRGGSSFNRYPQAIKNGADIEVSRKYRAQFLAVTRCGFYMAATYHTFTWTVSGEIQDFDETLETELKLVRVDTDEVMQVQTVAAGTTTYSFTVYDNTQTYQVHAFQNNQYVGSSGRGTAT